MSLAERGQPGGRWHGLGQRDRGRVYAAALLTLACAVELVLWGFDTTLRSGRAAPVASVVASAIVVFGLLWFRSRWPRAVFLVAWTYCVLWGVVLPAYQPFAALLIALYHVARHLPLHQAGWFLLLAVVPPSINARDAAVINGADVADAVLIGFLWCVIFGSVWAAGRWGRRAEQAARWREEKLTAESALALQNERLTLARELHDIVAHSVGSIIFQAAGARRVAEVDATRAIQSLDVIEACGVRVVEELRDLLGMLNSAADAGGADAPPSHLGLDGLEPLLDLTRLTGVCVELRRTGRPGVLSAHADHTAYRLVQEALTNAVKHSGRDLEVTVDIAWHADHADITVTSSSAAPAAPPAARSGGYGLAGMRHRVASVGGTFESGWQPEGTFRVRAQLPTDRPIAHASTGVAHEGRGR